MAFYCNFYEGNTRAMDLNNISWGIWFNGTGKLTASATCGLGTTVSATFDTLRIEVEKI